MSELSIPELSLVVLVGVSGSGKSPFAATHFAPTEVVSSDQCRAMVSDDQNDQDATTDAFDVLEFIAGKRLSRGQLTVVDATNVQPSARRSLLALAKAHDVLPVAIVLDLPTSLAIERNAARPDRSFDARVVKRQHEQLRRSMRGLKREGFRTIHVLDSVEAVAEAAIVRTRLFNDRRDEHGPFDVISDVHGCRDELEALLDRLGYVLVGDEAGRAVDAAHPDGRRAVFVGDVIDRGPDSPGVLRLVMGMVANANALCVSGNHEAELVRALGRKDVPATHGLQQTLEQLSREDESFVAEVRKFCDAGLKVRGRGYLRIIYDPDYTDPATLARLKQRNLGPKRSMALREYALGLEALRRATAGESVWRIHQCVFGVLALESEPVDPRL